MGSFIIIGMLFISPFQLIQDQTDSLQMRVPLPAYMTSPSGDAVTDVQQTAVQNETDSVASQVRIQTNTAILQADSILSGQKPLIEVPAEEEEESTPEALRNISLGKIFWSFIIFALGYLVIRFITHVLEIFSERSTSYRITLKGLVPVIRILGWIIFIFVIITGVIRPEIQAVLALTASVGVAVGFASQDILKNIFGGIVILLDTPFKVGDKIEIGSFYGEVVEIGLRSTRIVTPDDSLVSIPNGELMNQSVSNSNAGELNCQVVAEIYLPLDIDTVSVRKIAIEVAQTSKYVYLNKPITILFFNEIKERRSYLKMRVKAYVMDIRYEFTFKSELTEIVIRELLRQNIISRDDFK
ncbi:mechanosensitive ion channel family protein [Catalinimonas niigatensis]|uniref:mechanosensitive ion channel family protein n=1 Tax=Catalinimonas niigatensis TaxID=1397264 RepID=UPI0026671BD1|nr:mechanosensitive ion channel domain-containing protein [Catalinimonas niigatensis]WPP52708.1 mechanosensitive ion channel [Catalinimonas niigatensis]